MEVPDRWATFDCYGTLINWMQGMNLALESVVPENAARLLEHYHLTEPEVEAERPFRPYREVLAETLKRAAEKTAIKLPPGAEHVLAETLPAWPPFPDTISALQELKAEGWKLAILSNVDRDLIVGTLQLLQVPFDAIVTAEDVQAYKPSLEHFQTFLKQYAGSIEHWIHVAASYFHDIIPASELGVKGVWINRMGSSEAVPLARAVLPDLSQLPMTLRQLSSTV